MNWLDEQIELLKRGFVVRDCIIANTDCVLIYPSKENTFSINWDHNIIQYRSSIWTKLDKQLVSPSFKKFVNWGEKSDIFPLPETLNNAKIITKIDGSCLICSKYKGQLITRTRGTIDANTLDNGFEIELLKEIYPKAFDNTYINSEQYTLIYEWVSPINKIVIDYGAEPDLYLTGCIKHEDYSIFTQDKLDEISLKLEIKRPEVFNFKTIDDMLNTIKNIKGKEGIVLYYGKNEQNMLKVKGEEYITKHAFKSHCTIESIIDLFLSNNKPNYNEFIKQLTTDFDWECCQMAQGHVSKVCEAYKEVQKFLDYANEFVKPLRSLSRKDAALTIMKAYGNTSRSGFVFSALDNKTLTNENYKKLLFQILKK